MTYWKQLIEKDHMGAWDLVDRDGVTPKDWTLKIESVQSNVLKTRENPKGKRKCVIRFHGARKAFVSNTTNCETIESLYGPHVEEWIGKLVTLYQADVRSPKGKGTVKGIRVRSKRPAGQAEAIPDREPDRAMRDEQEEAFGREPGED